MNRREFTHKISLLILDMIVDGETPIFDWCYRSTQVQRLLWAEGRTKIKLDNNTEAWTITDASKIITKNDGIILKSNHQRGRAMDIYLVKEEDGIATVLYDWNNEKAKKWHTVWEQKYGGSPMISWDAPHFEG